MTTTDSIWAAAEHLLRRDAEELRESSTSSRDRDDWMGEEEAKADYDEHIATADALASLSTLAAQPPRSRDLSDEDMDQIAAWVGEHAHGDIGYHALADRIIRLCSTAAQPPAGWREALEFYAQGRHFGLSDESAWDTVSGEPQNFWCDEAGTATVEDGSIAKLALSGHAIRFEDEDTIAPSEQAPAQAAPAAVAGPVVAWRVVVRGVNSSAQRHWIDGAPSDEMLADFALNAPQASIQYAYAAPTTQAAPAAQGDALKELLAASNDLVETIEMMDEDALLALDDDPHPPSSLSACAERLRKAIDAARAAKEGGAA